jgi:cAMP-dependent protein kinase regulator
VSLEHQGRDDRSAKIAQYRALAGRHAQEGHLLKALEVQHDLRDLEGDDPDTEKTIVAMFAKRPNRPVSAAAPATPATPAAAAVAPVQMPAIPLFSDLPPAAFAAVTQSLRVHRCRPGQAVVREGDNASSMFAIVRGSVSIERLEHGVNVCLATMGEGDFFGEMGLISDSPRLATVRARDELAVLELMRDRLVQITAQHPAVGRVLDRFYKRRLITNVLRSNPMLQPLFRNSLQELMENFRTRSVGDGKLLLEEGQRGRGFYILLRGECIVSKRRRDGSAGEVARLREGDVFGEMSLLLDRPVTATVTAVGTCFVLRLAKEPFDAAIARAPEVRRALEELGRQRLAELGEITRPIFNV